jgi:D-alanyl-D-alanine carboxypeptidase
VAIDTTALQQRLDALMTSEQSPGAVLGLQVRGGKAIMLASGVEPGTNRKLIPTDTFRVASLTKTFVGALVLRLVDAGKIRLDEPLASYLPDWPSADKITIRHLLSHTSGIPPFGGDRGGTDPYADAANQFVLRVLSHRFTPDEILAFVRDRPLLFSPGSRSSYSNVNTILLGQVVEKVTGSSLVSELHRQLLDPLRLSATRYAAEEAASPVGGLTPVGNTTFNTATIDYTSFITSQGAAGAMVSNIPDLLAWGEAFLRSHTILRDDTARQVSRIGPGGTGPGVLGFSEDRFFCVFADDSCPPRTEFRAIGGSGAGPGTRTILLHDLPTDAVIAVIVNRDGTSGVNQFAVDVLNLVARAEGRR